MIQAIDPPVNDNESLPDGASFICEDCRSVVFSIGADPTPDLHVCYVCRFIRTVPNLTDDIKQTLRGER